MALWVCRISIIHPLTRAWLQACQQSGLPFNPDFNSGDPAGCGLYQITAKNNRRSSASTAYLKPARNRKNLTILTGAKVKRILLEKQRAVGVEYESGGKSHEIRAKQEVALSAGAINSPKLLMLSGIGPADALTDHGISVRHDLPGVGRNLQDHIEISLIYQLNGPHSYDKYKKPHWKAVAGLNYLLFGSGPCILKPHRRRRVLVGRQEREMAGPAILHGCRRRHRRRSCGSSGGEWLHNKSGTNQTALSRRSTAPEQ